MKNLTPRNIGLIAAGLLALTTALPWFSVNIPLFGSYSVNGFGSDRGPGDGIVFVIVCGALALTAWHGKVRASSVVAGLIAVGYIGEYIYAMITVAAAKDEAAKSGDIAADLADAATVSPGIGLILGVMIAGAACVWLGILHRNAVQGDLIRTHGAA